jgi:hypothetical protein
MAAQTERDVKRVVSALAPWDSGRDYMNFRETSSTGERLFSAERFARLREIKRRVDPTNKFTNVTARTVSYFDPDDPSKNDYRPGEHTLLIWGRASFAEKGGAQALPFYDAVGPIVPIRAHVDPALVELVVEKIDGSQVARDARVSGHQGAADPRS